MRVVNLFGGPGIGKSTVAAGLFHLLKVDGQRVELVTEFAKDLVWEKHHAAFEDQMWISANQWRRLYRLDGHDLDYVVTDSPLIMSTVYAVGMPNTFFELMYDLHSRFENTNVFLTRVPPYEEIGRVHDETEARRLDLEIESMLHNFNVPYITVEGGANAPQEIKEILYLAERRGGDGLQPATAAAP